MLCILEEPVRLAYPLGHHLHCLIAQIPNRLRRTAEGWRIADPEGQWRTILGPHHHLAAVRDGEYSTDDFGGAPLWRLRFGTATRLYYLNLPQHHEIDPRSSRIPLKVHAVYRPGPDGRWILARRRDRAAPDARAPGAREEAAVPMDEAHER